MSVDKDKILVITPRLPYPVIGGDKLRIYRICEKLEKEGFDLSLISFIEEDEERKVAKDHPKGSIFSSVETIKLPKWKSYMNAMLGFFTSSPLQVNYYKSRKMRRAVEKELDENDYDSVLAHLVRLAPYVADRKDVNKVLEMTDAISLNYERVIEEGGSGFWGVAYRVDQSRVSRYETECLKRFDSTVVVSSVDKEHLVEKAGEEFESKVKVIPNGVSRDFLRSVDRNPDPNTIVFMGNLRSYQNQDAIFYFLDEVYPLIREKHKDAKLKIVGAEPPKKLKEFDGEDGIEVTGRVEDIIGHIKDAGVSVAPVRIGAGIQNKVLESMALGVPVVTSRVGAEGIDQAREGKHFMVADDAEEMAEAALEVMKDDDLREKLSLEGKKLVQNHYSFDEMLEPYPDLFS